METVLIVCGAGASSTFLASRLRTTAKTRGIELATQAASSSDLRPYLHTATVLLVGPHLADSFATLEAEAALFGVPAALLAPTAFGPSGAEQALDLVGTLVTLGPSLTSTTSEATK
jgi:PTS system cellobiose-specific IIB component